MRQSSVFVSNRGVGSPYTNTITGFRVEPHGTVEFAQLAPSLTRFPRGMALSDAGTPQLLVAGQSSSNLVAFDIQGAGQLMLPGREVAAGLATPTTIVSYSPARGTAERRGGR
jgi:6-phosphogluconolactonase (cycloisomerase 2 family)